MKERIVQLIEYLKDKRVVLSQNEFAEKMGVRPSQLSEMINGKRAISERTINIIASVFTDVNTGWLLTGEGPMIKNTNTIEAPNAADAVSIPIEVWEVIKNQAESLKAKDDQNSQIIEILREQLKKTAIVAEKRRVANTVVVEVEE